MSTYRVINTETGEVHREEFENARKALAAAAALNDNMKSFAQVYGIVPIEAQINAYRFEDTETGQFYWEHATAPYKARISIATQYSIDLNNLVLVA